MPYYIYDINSEIVSQSDAQPTDGNWCSSDVNFDLDLNRVIVGAVADCMAGRPYALPSYGTVVGTFPATYPSCVSSSYFGVTPDGHFFYREGVNGLICGCSINSDGTLSDVQSIFATNNSGMNRFVVLN